MSMFDMYRKKPKKKEVDPNAPPRPNLLNHEKRLKDAVGKADSQAQQIDILTNKVADLERRLASQTAYLSYLHQHISRSKH